MKICFLVPDGVGLRNYLYSSLIDKFPEDAEILLLTVLPREVLDEVEKIHNRKFSYVAMTAYNEAFKGKLLKEAITYARLRYNTRKIMIIRSTGPRLFFCQRSLYKAAACIVGYSPSVTRVF